MGLGIALALGSAVAHAAWNTVVTRVSPGGLPALWAYSLASLVVVLPVWSAVATARGHAWPAPQLVALAAGSTLLHTAYAATVQRAYRHFDVSQVYPLSRGLAPVLVAGAGLVALAQPLTPVQWSGVLLMALAVASLAVDGRGARDDQGQGSQGQGSHGRVVLWSLGIAGTIAAYTLFDGWAVVVVGVDPLPYYALGATLQLVLVTALIRGDVRSGLAQLRQHARPVSLLAVLIPTSYLLGLHATQHAPVSLVAALRSTSLLWVAVAAALVLREPVGRFRVLATGLAVTAVVALAWHP